MVSMYSNVGIIADTDHDTANRQHRNQRTEQSSGLCIPHPCNVRLMLLMVRQVNRYFIRSLVHPTGTSGTGAGYVEVVQELLRQAEAQAHKPARSLVWLQAVKPVFAVSN